MAQEGHPGAHRVHARNQQGSRRIRRIRIRRRPGRPEAGQAGASGERRRADYGRRVSGGQGVSGRLLDRRRRESGAGVCDSRTGVGGAGTRGSPDEHTDRSAAGDERTARRTSVTPRVLDERSEHLLRDLAPQVLGAVIRRFRDFTDAEDAVQEALVAAAVQWPWEGVPDNPRAWLIQVASRRMTDHVRSEMARRHRESVATIEVDQSVSAPVIENRTEQDDTLVLLFMCCHPALTPSSAIALTLRAVGGLTTAEIANAFLVPEATMAQRISRAKQTIKASGVPFRLPSPQERAERLPSVQHVLYLIFSEGYVSSVGSQLQRLDLSREAIRLTRNTKSLVPDNPEIAGLLALML